MVLYRGRVGRLWEGVGRETTGLGDAAETMCFILPMPAYAVGGCVRDLLSVSRICTLTWWLKAMTWPLPRRLPLGRGCAITHARFGTAVVMFPDDFKLDVA